MPKPYKAITNLQYPYRAIICGEEHVVKGWQGGHLLTDIGDFVFRRLQGNQVESEWAGELGRVPCNCPIESTRILEVAMLQSNGNGRWLLNGRDLSLLERLSAGTRLHEITLSEVLRVHKGEIQAVAWVEAFSGGSVTVQLDTVLAEWKSPQKHPPFDSFDRIRECVSGWFAGWSKPIWLAEFHKVGANKNPWMEGLSEKLQTAKSDSAPPRDSLADMLDRGDNPWLAGLKNVSRQPANATVEAVEPTKNKAAKEQDNNATLAAKLMQTQAELRKTKEVAKNTLREALSKWMHFDPPSMSADTKARIEKAVKMYLTDPDKRSLAKIAAEFGVSRKTVSGWFQKFTEETGYSVVTHQRHESVSDKLKAEAQERVQTDGRDRLSQAEAEPQEE